jgi:hypothetical protein
MNQTLLLAVALAIGVAATLLTRNSAVHTKRVEPIAIPISIREGRNESDFAASGGPGYWGSGNPADQELSGSHEESSHNPSHDCHGGDHARLLRHPLTDLGAVIWDSTLVHAVQATGAAPNCGSGAR